MGCCWSSVQYKGKFIAANAGVRTGDLNSVTSRKIEKEKQPEPRNKRKREDNKDEGRSY